MGEGFTPQEVINESQAQSQREMDSDIPPELSRIEGVRTEKEASPEIDQQRPFDAVIVLGAGIEDPLWKKFQQKYPEGSNPRGVNLTEKSSGWMLGPDARMRTIAAAQMYLQGITSKIIFTGGPTAKGRGIEASEAKKMKEYVSHLLKRGGVDEETINKVIILEDQATNTIENVARVCNIIDGEPEKYQNMAILTNQYHLERSKELIQKFNLEAEGFNAEDLLGARSKKYQSVLQRFFSSAGYQDKLKGERRWMQGLKEIPEYWMPQALAVENPQRIDYILESLGLEGATAQFQISREDLVKLLRKVPREIPPESWGEETK